MTIPFYVAPEQLVRDKAEFARKGIARGRSILALEYADGVVLIAENPSSALHKISEVYDRIAFAGVGKYNEFETLRKAGIRQADLMGYLYSRDDVTAMSLATQFAQTMGVIFTRDPKPFEVELLLAEISSDGAEHRLFRVTYDGTLFEERNFVAIGGKSEQLEEALEDLWSADMDLDSALEAGKQAFQQAEGRDSEGWEIAVLDSTNGRRAFRRISTETSPAAGKEPAQPESESPE
ncbi:MAG: proteasome subunit alpha [Actinobacteria bacterium]|nr:MAG: proteasome subunit alpha [Actinomycetota bacterium]REK35511.1 MAG: proteasome subunit alpha [Actinomycetota bacterium]